MSTFNVNPELKQCQDI